MNNKNHADRVTLYRNPIIAENIIFLDGISGTGKTLILPILSSYDNIEIGTDGTFIEIYLHSEQMDGANGNNAVSNTYDAGIQNSTLYHLVFTYDSNDAAGNEGRLFINGSNVQSWSHWGGNLVQANSSPITIGDTDHIETPFDGLIDDIAVWDTAISDTEVSDIFGGTSPSSTASSNLVG